jgi:hypothetical protein
MEPNEDLVEHLSAYRHRDRWGVWCRFCAGWHFHPKLGFNEARCASPNSSYLATGYFLIDRGTWTPAVERKHRLEIISEARI